MLRRILVVLLCVVLPTIGLATTASATVLWADEAAMIGNNPYRDTYVYRLPIGSTISYEQFAAPDVTAFYTSHGFDRNFMYWAPIEAIDRPQKIWNGCTGNAGGLCQNLHNGVQTIFDEVSAGQIHVKKFGDSFIGVACGNWHNAGPGPVPTISGTKYEDVNGNGVRDTGEPGLAGWTIDLSLNGSPVTSTTTDANGDYTFALNANTLPVGAGTYTLTERQQPGWVRSQAPDPVPVGYGAGQNSFGGNNFGNYRPATIQGRKFDDHGVDGQGAGDPGVPNWTINLSNGAAASTQADGGFAFGGLRPGTYTVSEQPRAGWRQTAPSTGTHTVTVASGEVHGGVDFGNVCLGSIAVTVPAGVGTRFDEVNVPGILHNDLPLTGSGLLPGTYRVTLTLPDGVFTTDPDLTSVDGHFAIVKTVTVAECAATAVAPVFVTSQPGKITGGIRIAVPGGFATGGFEFMQRNDGPRGTLEFNDHAADVRIHTSDITGISVLPSGTEAYVFGHAAVGGTTYGFRLHLVDAGEPGTSDRFELVVANGYTAGFNEVLDGGNVQIH